MMWTDDPIADAENYTYEQERKKEKLPKCCECGEYIDSECLYDMPDGIYCEECIDGHKRYVDY